MRLEDHGPDQQASDRLPRQKFVMLLGVLFGIAVFGLAAWFLVARIPKQAHSVQSQPQAVPSQGVPATHAPAEQLADFVASILGSTEDVWREQFQMLKLAYKEPRLVLFTRRTLSKCGDVSSAVGPAYCPLDAGIYVDLSFFKELEQRYGARGDFARAYVIAHEVGHHVQKLMGIPEKELARQPEFRKDQTEPSSVRVELQADYLAGVWAHHAQKARHILEPGDVEAALGLLAAIGDDRQQLDTQGDVDARSITRCWDRKHGTAQQKVHWFRRGLETGDVSQGASTDGSD